MENQHRKISGYRELTQHEIDLMNRVKALGIEIGAVCDAVREHTEAQFDSADDTEMQRLIKAEPRTWADTGKTQLQIGLMALTRAVAQPTFF